MIPVTDAVRQQLVAAGARDSQIRTITNGIDFARATAATRDRLQVLSSLGIDPDEPLVLLFGYDPMIKGVDTAIAGVAQLVREGQRMTLGIVGTQKLADYVHGRTGNTPPRWLRIIAPAEDVANLYRAATLFLCASRNEGLPYAVCEAMANRLPVVLSDIPGVSWAHRSPGSVFFPSGSASDLAAAIRRVLQWSPAERAEYTAANDYLVRAEFDVADWAERIAKIYEEILPFPGL
jgi:glycosyltransferase involved in cell wall biosynthesis